MHSGSIIAHLVLPGGCTSATAIMIRTEDAMHRNIGDSQSPSRFVSPQSMTCAPPALRADGVCAAAAAAAAQRCLCCERQHGSEGGSYEHAPPEDEKPDDRGDVDGERKHMGNLSQRVGSYHDIISVIEVVAQRRC
jgi:hypothetical protein